jgi:hypothetical protein
VAEVEGVAEAGVCCAWGKGVLALVG